MHNIKNIAQTFKEIKTREAFMHSYIKGIYVDKSSILKNNLIILSCGCKSIM